LLASASPTATILDYNLPFVYEKSANGYRLKTRLSHAWGSVQQRVIADTYDALVCRFTKT
jgi:hypothetical protein